MMQILRTSIAVLFFSVAAVIAFGQKNNEKPTITGQTPSPLSTNQGTPITIQLSNLIVTDPDSEQVYPDGFSLEIRNGKDYKADGNTVTPDPGFSGLLLVDVRVNDGKHKSDKFDLQINVIKTENTVPRITGQQPLNVDEDGSLVITLSNLLVDDDDNDYPQDFTLSVFGGQDYSFNGSTITPTPGYSGQLKVPVSVNDGQNESNRFELKIDVKKKKNVKPRITAQQPLVIDQGESLTLQLSNLIVDDADNNYPEGFSLKIFGGRDYTLNGTTITPSPDFVGELTVPVTVNDGEDESKRFDLKIDVREEENVAPQITGQQALSMVQGENITLTLAQLSVTDPDDSYPTGFTLKIYPGSNYSFSGTTITPTPGFLGQLTVSVTVNDGQNESNRFDLKIDVREEENVAPQITGQQALSIVQGQNLTLTLAQLTVTDPDDSYPTGFTLKIYPGSNYSLSGTTITPTPDFLGQLIVPVTVNDGQNESNRFDLKIDVTEAENVAPQIIGQQTLSLVQGENITLTLEQITVTDPDNSYPTGFTLQVYGGSNYTFNGTTVTPSADFVGQLTVPVTVNDGQDPSNRFDLKIVVTEPENVPPQITGQQALSMVQGENITLTLAQLSVTDPDDSYPTGFTLKIYPGSNYSFSGTTITPTPGFLGQLTVPVTVNDGQNESNQFSLKVNVITAQNASPEITGQVALNINEDEALALNLSHLTVSDTDNSYPQDFVLKISPGSNYTVQGLTITPAQNYAGQLSVPVVVNDGSNDSAPFNIKINVSAVNDAPLITGQQSLSTNKNTIIAIPLSALSVVDPDNTYPTDFSLKVLGGNNYSIAGNLISPAIDFTGTLTVVIMVNDGKSNSPTFNLKVDVISPDNNAPVITGQRPVQTSQGVPVSIQLSYLLVTDRDNDYPHGFTLRVLPGTDYTVAGNTITPKASIVDGTFAVTVLVNDGSDDSAPFPLLVKVIPPSAKPLIVSQKELRMAEDSTLTIGLNDLVVTDADNGNYPVGYVLIVSASQDGTYSRSGNSITPAHNLNGFIEVGVRVSDGVNTSDEFKLALLINPVNDPPEFVNADTASLAYDPGRDPLTLFGTIGLRDVDDDHLIMAEVGFEGTNFNPENDQCILSIEQSAIRPVYDSAGRLFLIGYAPIDAYLEAIQHIQYNYQLSQDVNGKTRDIQRGPRTVYLTISDGHLASATMRRKISMELEITLDIPNAFSPNGDRQNDTWHIDLVNADDVQGARLRIFDKRGTLIYESVGLEQDWDGSFDGRMLPVDTYFYTIDLDLSYTRKSYRGTVVVLY